MSTPKGTPQPEPRPPLAPGVSQALGGHFDLLAEVGRGSSGTVHKARLRAPYKDLPAGAEVAIKFLRKELAVDEKAQARFFAEGELGQTLAHPNVAAIYGVETIELLGLPITYLVMQYVPGTTLREFVAKSGAPVEDLTRRIGADAAAGLFALHRRGLVHRDIKPENLILTPDSRVCIVDLGLARPFAAGGAGAEGGSGSAGSGSGGSGSSGSGGSGSGSAGSGSAGSGGSSSGHSRRSSGGFAGSLAYTAPEVLQGKPSGPRADLYALGVVLFEVTTGRHPFHNAGTADEMMLAHRETPPPRPSHLRARISPLLEQVLLDLLQKDPDRRLKDAAELQRVLQQGEQSEYWRRHEARAPALASGRRLLRMRRPADTPFFGRTAELTALDAELALARTGVGRVVVVSGPEGIGRRRLYDEAMAGWLEGKQAPLYLGGDADSGLGHGEPFASALLDWLLRGDGRDSPQAAPRAAAAAVALLQCSEAEAEALAAVALGTSTEPPEVRADRLASALLRLPQPQRPLVLRVDHAERLDTSGRLVLQRLAARGRTQPLLLLLATGLEPVAVDVDRRLDLVGLEEAEFLAFGRALFRPGAVDEAFLAGAHQMTSGLPGNLVEALDHLAQEGAVQGRAGDYHSLQPGVELRPAPSHLARFRARVASLDAAQRAVLAATAVLGERCRLDDLAELVGSPPLAVLETLSLFRGRIVRAQGGEVSFRHRDFLKVLLSTLAAEARADLHRRAAALLARRGRPALEIGMHLSQALEHEACLDPLLQGLDERVRAGSRRTALRIAGRLAVHFAAVPDHEANRRRRLRYLLLAGKARVNAGQHEAASRDFQRAETLAQTLGDVEGSAAARTALAARALDAGRLWSAIALLESVHDDLQRATGPGPDALAAQAHGLHGRILLYRGQAADGNRQLQAALHRLPSDQDDLRCHLLVDLARIEALQHHYPTALKTLQRVEQNQAARALPRVRLRLHLYRGQVRAVLGDDEAAQDLRFAVDEAERLSLPAYAGRATLFLAERQFWRRRDDEARHTFARAAAMAHAGGDRLGEAMARAYLLRLGANDPDLAALVESLELPSVRCNWILAQDPSTPLDEARRSELEALLAETDLPLSLHLRALERLERPASARSLARTIAERVPSRSSRQRFLATWGRGARI
ncbi:MAG: serine/threonine protein kinase [Planctomycetes bacterium]|nr:serine/threonine protein kinase [Planctomycetota bacterium]